MRDFTRMYKVNFYFFDLLKQPSAFSPSIIMNQADFIAKAIQEIVETKNIDRKV